MKPPPYIQATYKYVKNHKWYMEPRLVTVNDLYAFDPNEKVTLDPFIDIIGRQFKQPKEGLGFDNSPGGSHVAHHREPGRAAVNDPSPWMCSRRTAEQSAVFLLFSAIPRPAHRELEASTNVH